MEKLVRCWSWKEIASYQTKAVARLTTGVAAIDTGLRGLPSNAIHVFVGSPKQGKSWAIESLGLWLAQNHEVVLVSCENGINNDAERLQVMERTMEQQDVTKVPNLAYYDLARISGAEGLAQLKQIVAAYDDVDAEEQLRQMSEQGYEGLTYAGDEPMRVLIIDAPERLVDTGTLEQTHQLGRQFVDWLITIKDKWTIICSWQATKSAIDKQGALSSADLSGSSAISQACDSFWFVKDKAFWCCNARQDIVLNRRIRFEPGKGISKTANLT